jgi:hypothetical protein
VCIFFHSLASSAAGQAILSASHHLTLLLQLMQVKQGILIAIGILLACLAVALIYIVPLPSQHEKPAFRMELRNWLYLCAAYLGGVVLLEGLRHLAPGAVRWQGVTELLGLRHFKVGWLCATQAASSLWWQAVNHRQQVTAHVLRFILCSG